MLYVCATLKYALLHCSYSEICSALNNDHALTGWKGHQLCGQYWWCESSRKHRDFCSEEHGDTEREQQHHQDHQIQEGPVGENAGD